MAASASPSMAPSLLPMGLVLLILSGTDALRATPGSSCSTACGDTSKTNSSDIVCSDYDYYSTGSGSTFKDCLTCLQTSNATSESENDLSWFLYNLRYASAVCIYDFPTHNTTKSSASSGLSSSSSCDLQDACLPLQGAFEYGNLDPSNETQFGYCQADNNAFYGTGIDDCVSCLQSSPSTYTANFLLALEAGCQQEPAAGSTLSITGSLFSTSAVNITVPSNSSSAASSSSSDRQVLSQGSIVAIVVSLGVLFLIAIGLFILYCSRQRRYEREDARLLRDSYIAHQHQQQYYYSKDGSPLSSAQTYAMPHYTVDYKSQPAANANLFGASTEDLPPQAQAQAQGQQQQYHHPYKGEDEGFASNAEYYDRLARARAQPLQAHPVKLSSAPSVTSEEVDAIGNLPTDALPAHPAYIPRGQLGGRTSRASTTNRSTASGRSSAQGRRPSVEQPQQAARRGGTGRTADSYAIQVYLNGSADEPGASAAAARGIERAPSRSQSRNAQMELAGPPEAYAPPGRQQTGRLYTPPSLSDLHKKSATPAPPEGAAPPNMASLILPSVPRIRVPGRKPSKLKLNEDDAGSTMGISGPLAFPDARFSVRPPNDRIVEQTLVERGGQQHMEVPIASGKSFLYG